MKSFIFSAAPDVNYTPLSTTLVFPVGSSRLHRLCANVLITSNRDINPDRVFGLKAVILSPASATFGGSDQRSAGIIDAVIVDDDGALTFTEAPFLSTCGPAVTM